MAKTHLEKIAAEIKVVVAQVAAVVELLDDDATVPFIARYRKEATGELDEVAISEIRDRIAQLRELDRRRLAILKSLTERELITDELTKKINGAESVTALEDIYLPYRPKRRTKATIAIEKGLQPLAELIFSQDDIDPHKNAEQFIDPEKSVADIETALTGARDIIAGWINEDADARAHLRELFGHEGLIQSKVIRGKEAEGDRFSDYFDWKESISKIALHRILALLRGEKASIISLHIFPPEDKALSILERMFVLGENQASAHVRQAMEDSYRRLLQPAMESETFALLKKEADKEAISVFAKNLRQLLMAAPLGRKNVMAIDPGFRTGCKVVCLDRQGDLDYNMTIFPHTGEKKRLEAATEIKALCEKYKINIIAVGNGTAGRETEAFIHEIGLPENIIVQMVSEAGASIYSVSAVAREEFPEFDATVRGSVSIGRRLLDPLAELVKIDPGAIGVGQYQHDVDQTALKRSLDDTVAGCVNAVGVNVNTVGKELLTYVSGLGPQLAANIIAWRKENGPFKSRKALMKVPRMGAKAFEQSAGFLRITDAADPLDSSAVHPESYPIVGRMAKDLNCTIEQLIADKKLRDKINLEDYVSERVGLPTLHDIMDELARPGRDPREEFIPFGFDPDVRTIDDLEVDMILSGIITNVTSFGAFVDIGVHQDGLVHISELADGFVGNPTDVVRVHQQTKVKVLDIDIDRRRIALSIRQSK